MFFYYYSALRSEFCLEYNPDWKRQGETEELLQISRDEADLTSECNMGFSIGACDRKKNDINLKTVQIQVPSVLYLIALCQY